jgi:hypothetical protein
MRVVAATFALSASLSLAACGDERKTTADATDTMTSNDSGDDTSTPDTADDTSEPGDTAGEDTTSPGDTATTDTSEPGDTTASDTTEPTPGVAVPGSRCAPSELVARIEVETWDGSMSYLNAWVYDRPNPAIGAPELTSDDCAFHRQPTGCSNCGDDETCAIGSVCAALPAVRTDTTVVVTGEADATQTMNPDEWGNISEQINLKGEAFAVAVTFAGQTVSVPATAIPANLTSATGILDGDYMSPDGLRLEWTGGANGAHVFTHIPINHHVRGYTFTQCQAPADAGVIQVGGDMLKPLSVVTGLEFQGIDHVRFAAADTEAGCVEFRFLRRQWVEIGSTIDQ